MRDPQPVTVLQACQAERRGCRIEYFDDEGSIELQAGFVLEDMHVRGRTCKRGTRVSIPLFEPIKSITPL